MPTPPPHPRRPGYGVVEYTDGAGFRFVAWGQLTEAAVAELCAVARKHGCQPTDTSRFLTESKPH